MLLADAVLPMEPQIGMHAKLDAKLDIGDSVDALKYSKLGSLRADRGVGEVTSHEEKSRGEVEAREKGLNGAFASCASSPVASSLSAIMMSFNLHFLSRKHP